MNLSLMVWGKNSIVPDVFDFMWGNIHISGTAAFGDFDIHLITTDTRVANCIAFFFIIPYIEKRKKKKLVHSRQVSPWQSNSASASSSYSASEFLCPYFPFSPFSAPLSQLNQIVGVYEKEQKKVLFVQFWKSQVFYIHCTTSFLTCDVPTSRRNDPRNPVSPVSNRAFTLSS